MHAETLAQHRWLQQLVGEWTSETEANMGPDTPPMRSTGTERVRMLGELWVLCEGEGNMTGGSDIHRTLITIGFDPKRDAFVGSFVASMMHMMWLYEGQLDASQRVLTLAADGPSFDDDKRIAHYHDTITLISDDERTLTSSVQMPDGQWNQFMKATYRRKR